MSIDEKVSAVEEFLDWREETGAVSLLRESLSDWRVALIEFDRANLLRDLRDRAQWALDNPDEALKLADYILESVDG